jgi:hypothetical protein
VTGRPTRKLRCAVYTRKSSEEGLEQEFNSLHAQREAGLAYIARQKSEGWIALQDHFDDGGISLVRRTREAIADGYDTCPVTSVPAADVEGAVVDQVQKLLAAPESVARIWAAAKREGGDGITEREVTALLVDFAAVWNELFPAEQARIVQLLVERVDVQDDALEVRIRAEGLASLVGELRQQDERKAA